MINNIAVRLPKKELLAIDRQKDFYKFFCFYCVAVELNAHKNISGVKFARAMMVHKAKVMVYNFYSRPMSRIISSYTCYDKLGGCNLMFY